MTLEETAIVSQIVSGLGVVGSLIFVGFQVRQSNQMMRDTAIRHHAERIQSVSKAVFEVPDLADIWLRGGEDIGKLSPEERVRFINLNLYVLRIWEQLHLQKERGMMDEQMWDANINILRDIPPAVTGYSCSLGTQAPSFFAPVPGLLRKLCRDRRRENTLRRTGQRSQRMNLGDWANLGQIIGAIAVVVSLFYVAYQEQDLENPDNRRRAGS